MLQSVGDQVNASTILSNIAMIHIEAGQFAEAEQRLRQAVEIDRQFNLPALEEDRQALAWVQHKRQETGA